MYWMFVLATQWFLFLCRRIYMQNRIIIRRWLSEYQVRARGASDINWKPNRVKIHSRVKIHPVQWCGNWIWGIIASPGCCQLQPFCACVYFLFNCFWNGSSPFTDTVLLLTTKYLQSCSCSSCFESGKYFVFWLTDFLHSSAACWLD